MNESDEKVERFARKVKDLPSVEFLHECFHYKSDTGELLWKERPVEHFKSERSCRAWNTRFKGKKAGTVGQHRGYILIHMQGFGRSLKAHRIIWTMLVGPIERGFQMDHINGKTSDNRLENLRPATSQQNHWNSRNRDRRLEYEEVPRGVYKHRKKWKAKIFFNQKGTHLGTFDTPEEASAAYRKAYAELAGEFAKKEAALRTS